MESGLTRNHIAAKLRAASGQFFAAAQIISGFLIGGLEAISEQEALERAVSVLEPCRMYAMPCQVPGTRPQAYTPLELTPELLSAIGLREENVNRLGLSLVKIESTLESAPLSKGAESIMKQLEGQAARSEQVGTVRIALATLKAVRPLIERL